MEARADGSLGPLFINRRQRLVPGVTYEAECHPTKVFASADFGRGRASVRAPAALRAIDVWRAL
jgi:hypothetical protein